MSHIKNTVSGIKCKINPNLIKTATKDISVFGAKKIKLLYEQIVQKKPDTEEQLEKTRFNRQLIIRKKDDQYISHCIVIDEKGNVVYFVQSSFAKNRRCIYIFNQNHQLVASATEDQPLFSFWGTERKTVFSVNIAGSVFGTATPETKGFHRKIQLEPQKWSTIETRHKCEIIGLSKEVIAETVGIIRKQKETPILFSNPKDELLALLVFLLQTALSPLAFNKAFERYYSRKTESYSRE